ncbi:MAG: hypothetical protein JOZ18_01990 [Chloroflexi bacterium]|nr:hypothetical protein [Chloroflexota bacterium]
MSTPEQELGCLYPFGYSMPDSVARLDALMSDQHTLLFDTRYSPYSRMSEWRQDALRARYGGKYHYTGLYLGNVNYDRGGPMRIAEPYEGTNVLLLYLRLGFNLVLLCGCLSYERCHRSVLVELVREREPEVRVIQPDEVGG